MSDTYDDDDDAYAFLYACRNFAVGGGSDQTSTLLSLLLLLNTPTVSALTVIS